MADETRMTCGMTELNDFGTYLNSLHDKDLTFEIQDVDSRMKTCSLNDAISKFQTFVAGKTESFKVRITYENGLMHKTTEYKKRRENE